VVHEESGEGDEWVMRVGSTMVARLMQTEYNALINI